MARHEIVIHENTGATKEVAPYLGSYIAKETLQIPAFAATIGNKCGLPSIQVIAILTGSFEAIQALERESLVRAWTDIGVVCAVITGSFPTADAAFDPARNALELALRLDEDIRLDLTDAVPMIVTDEDVTRLRVDNVMDLEIERPMNLIHGQHTFRVAGFNMVLGDEGAAAYLQNAQGTTFPLVIDEVVSKQLFKAHTAELLPGGDYKLIVKSRAGDAAGPLQTSFRKVKYLRVEDPAPVVPAPTIDAAGTQGCEPGTIEAPGGVVEVRGSNLETATAIDLLVGDDGAPVEDMELWQSLTATYDAESGVLTTNGVIEDSALRNAGLVRVTTAGGSATYPVLYTVH
jgi:hypothetical protein